MSAPTSAFAFIDLPATRSITKPRKTGLTMMFDQGLPAGYQQDLVETAGAYIDLAKFKTGTSRLYSEKILRRKIDQYRAADIKPFIGGQFHEYVLAVYGATSLGQFYAEARRIGFATIEISDNVVPLTAQARRDHIAAACNAGLEVFGEVGAKDRRSTLSELVEQAGICFDAGASLVLVEAAELVTDGIPNHELLNGLARQLDMKRVMIELPAAWIAGVRTCDVEALKKLLVQMLGPDVNVANVHHDTIIDFEATRAGLGVAGPHNYVAQHP